MGLISPYTINPENISPSDLLDLYNIVRNAKLNKGGKISVPTLLAIIGFDEEVEKRISRARGVIEINCDGSKCSATNFGKEISEDVPGTGGALGVIMKESLSCEFNLTEDPRKIIVDNIKGLDADIAGPFNSSIDKIVFILPRTVMIYF